MQLFQVRGVDTIRKIKTVLFDLVAPLLMVAAHHGVDLWVSRICVLRPVFQPRVTCVSVSLQPVMADDMRLANKPGSITVQLQHFGQIPAMRFQLAYVLDLRLIAQRVLT